MIYNSLNKKGELMERFTEIFEKDGNYILNEVDTPLGSCAPYIYDNLCNYFVKGTPSEKLNEVLKKYTEK